MDMGHKLMRVIIEMNFRDIHTLFIRIHGGMLRKSLLIKQISKFSFVGILNTIVGYAAFLFFLSYANYIISLIISHLIGVMHSYVWNKYWTFKTNKIQMKEFMKFYSVYAIIFVVNAIILIFLVDILKFNPEIGQLIVLPIITIISFTGHKYWSFKK